MKKNILGAVIKDARKKRKLTQKDLSKLTGYSQNTISNHENGNRSLDEDNIKTYAAALGLTSDDLFDALDIKNSFESEIMSVDKQQTKIDNTLDVLKHLEEQRQIKVYNFAKHQLDEQRRLQTNNKVIVMMPTKSTTVEIAGKLSAGGGTYNDKNCVETVEVGSTPSHYDLAFQVTGDSMYPTFEDGEIVFVKETNDVYNGQIGAVEINGEAFIKKMYLEGNRLRLVSLNADVDKNGNRLYPDFYSDELDDLYIIGRVII